MAISVWMTWFYTPVEADHKWSLLLQSVNVSRCDTVYLLSFLPDVGLPILLFRVPVCMLTSSDLELAIWRLTTLRRQIFSEFNCTPSINGVGRRESHVLHKCHCRMLDCWCTHIIVRAHCANINILIALSCVLCMGRKWKWIGYYYAWMSLLLRHLYKWS